MNIHLIRLLVLAALFFALTCAAGAGPAAAFAAIGQSKSQVEQLYGDYCFVQDTSGRFWTQSQWRTMTGAVAKHYGYRPQDGAVPMTVWIEYNNRNSVVKETVIMDSGITIRDFKNYFGRLHAGLIAPDSKACLIRAFPKDQLGVVMRQAGNKLTLVRFFPADPDDKTTINMHTRVNGFEIAGITASAVKRNLTSSPPAPWLPAEKPAGGGIWTPTDNFFRPELYFSEKLRPRPATDMIVIHHTKIENMSVADIHELHLKNGWAGIGYHKVVLPDATVEDGRPENMTGAHALGANHRSIGLVVVGDFETGRPTPAQLNVLVGLTLQLMEKYHITLENVVPHRAVTAGTVCPGPLFPWDELVQALQAKMAQQ